VTDSGARIRVIRNTGHLPQPLTASIVTIGNFDGVHVAHQELLRRVVDSARQTKAAAVAVTFDPHPTQVLAPSRAPAVLTPLETKISLIADYGVDLLWVIPFTQAMSRMSPAEFVQSFLVNQLRAAEVHVGENFCFGRDRQGDVGLLARLGRERGFRVTALPLFDVRGQKVSSSRIRGLLSEGRIELANRLLGRPFSVEGSIVPGDGIGAKQTVPTLNLAPLPQQLPGGGVYVTRTRLAGRAFESVANVGHKPTFGAHPLTIESYLLNFKGKVEANQMRIEFLYRLREERKFPEVAALKAQIQRDAVRSLKYFRLTARIIRPSMLESASRGGIS
jgi:riboflavin kinase / FMN adenylyltransferase